MNFLATRGLLALVLCTSTISAAAASHCPPLGPVFPAPRTASKHPAVQAAVKHLDQAMDAFTAGLEFSAVSVGVQSIHEDGILFNKHHTPPVSDPRGTLNVDSKTVFRVGSVSKLFTMLAVLKLPGVSLDDPITKYAPELQAMADKTKQNGCFPSAGWNDITIGALASHLAGIGSDFASDLSNYPGPWTELGLPAASAPLALNCAGVLGLRPCNRTDFFNLFGHHYPVFAPFTSPVYSNVGYAILAFVIENMSNTTFDAFLHKEVLGPLGLTHTSTSEPPVPDSLGFIPDGDIWWGSTFGFEDLSGSFYSNLDDFLAFGKAILKNTLLSPAATRKWMKPTTSTSSTGTQLGAAWEIFRSDSLTSDGRFLEVYTKSGDIGKYHAQLGLIPDYGLVVSIMMSGNETSTALAALVLSTITTTLLPALETAGREESEASFVGTYMDVQSNSSLVLTIDDGPGLVVSSWIMNGVDVLANYYKFSSMRSISPDAPVSVRLYPSDLVSGSHQSWRTVFETETPKERAALDASVFWPRASCLAWASLDRIVYQHRALDELVFSVWDGMATSVTPSMFQLELQRG